MRALERLDLRVVPPRVLRARVKRLLRGHRWKLRAVLLEAGFRARVVRRRPANVAALWYPRPGAVRAAGRANARGEPVFYASEDERTAVREAQAKQGDEVCILRVRSVRRVRLVEIERGARGSGGSRSLRSAALRKFLVRQFTRPVRPGHEHEYALCLAIADLHRAVDGLRYPSSPRARLVRNLALWPGSADRALEPVSCVHARVTRLRHGRARLERLAASRSIARDGAIRWQRVP